MNWNGFSFWLLSNYYGFVFLNGKYKLTRIHSRNAMFGSLHLHQEQTTILHHNIVIETCIHSLQFQNIYLCVSLMQTYMTTLRSFCHKFNSIFNISTLHIVRSGVICIRPQKQWEQWNLWTGGFSNLKIGKIDCMIVLTGLMNYVRLSHCVFYCLSSKRVLCEVWLKFYSVDNYCVHRPIWYSSFRNWIVSS